MAHEPACYLFLYDQQAKCFSLLRTVIWFCLLAGQTKHMAGWLGIHKPWGVGGDELRPLLAAVSVRWALPSWMQDRALQIFLFLTAMWKDDCLQTEKDKEKKRALSTGQLSTDVTASEMGLKTINSKCLLDPDYIMELGNNIRKFSPYVTIFERSNSFRRFFLSLGIFILLASQI